MQLTSKEILQRFPDLAESQILLAGYRGSHAHGTYLPPSDPNGTDDIDLFAVFSRGCMFYGSMYDYERPQETFTSAGETLDIEAVELRKFLVLCAKGNPNVHGYLWTDPSDMLVESPAGKMLRFYRGELLSQQVFKAFLGYVNSRLRSLQAPQKARYMGAKREELLQLHGYDIKDAAHCVRLAYQIGTLAVEQRIPVRLDGDVLTTVKAIKTGTVPLAEATATIAEYLSTAEMLTKNHLANFPERVSTETLQKVFVQVVSHTPWGGPSC